MSGECREGGGFSPPERGGCIASGTRLGSGHAPSLPQAEGPLVSLLGQGSLQPVVVVLGSPGGGTAQDFQLPMPCRRGWELTTGSCRTDATLADVQRWGRGVSRAGLEPCSSQGQPEAAVPPEPD